MRRETTADLDTSAWPPSWHEIGMRAVDGHRRTHMKVRQNVEAARRTRHELS